MKLSLPGTEKCGARKKIIRCDKLPGQEKRETTRRAEGGGSNIGKIACNF